MKALLKGSLSVLVGLMAARGFAEDVPWRPAGNPPAFQRVAAQAGPAVTLSRPVPVSAADGNVAFTPAAQLDRPAPLFRAKTTDQDDLPQLMPIGPAPVVVTQPGTVKPMGTSAPLIAPRESNTFSAPAPRLIYSNSGTVVGSDTAIISNGGSILGDCGDGCGACASSVCGPCWGQRLRDACGVCSGCCDNGCCLPRPSHWIRGEYILWDISRQHIPPLLTIGGVPEIGGDLHDPTATILFGDDQMRQTVQSGARFSMGGWFPRHCDWGLDFGGFMLLRRSGNFQYASNAAGNPKISVPFNDTVPVAGLQGEAAQIISDPGNEAGGVRIDYTTRLWGVEANLRHKWCCGPCYWLDGFIGFRHLQLSDSFDRGEAIRFLNPQEGESSFITVHDSFNTRNSFDGFQFGFEGEWRLWRRWFLAGSVKLGLGNVHQTVNIDGQTSYFGAQGQSLGTATGGLFALVSNIGHHERNEFGVVPEFGIKLGYDVTDHWRLYAGYNLLYVSNVVRAGEQIDRHINSDMVPERPGPGRVSTPPLSFPCNPAVLFRQTDFWAQGGQFGVEYHW